MERRVGRNKLRWEREGVGDGENGGSGREREGKMNSSRG